MKKTVIYAMVLGAFCGCSKKEEPKVEAPAPEQPAAEAHFADVAERMADTNYVAALKAQAVKQKAIADKMAAAKTDEEKKAAALEFEKNRQESMSLIRQKMGKIN